MLDQLQRDGRLQEFAKLMDPFLPCQERHCVMHKLARVRDSYRSYFATMDFSNMAAPTTLTTCDLAGRNCAVVPEWRAP